MIVSVIQMRIHTDTGRCAGTAMCMLVAPKIFTVGEDDVVELRTETPETRHHPAVREAVRTCPTAAISVRESTD